jgi:SAM-dependent methyltransferase
LLDVGCGGGFFLQQCRQRGFDVTGLEVSRQGAERARVDFGDRILNLALEDANLAENSFDVVSLNNVLEHFLDPVGALSKVRSLLVPGGLVTVSVPNVMFARIAHTMFGPLRRIGVPNPLDRIELLHAPNHLFAFSAHTLRMLFERVGFTGVEFFCEVPVWEGKIIRNMTKWAQYQIARAARFGSGRRLIIGQGITSFARVPIS